MKRTSLLLALTGAFGLALLGSASKAMATCAAGTFSDLGTVASSGGVYAFYINGYETDSGSAGDPAPAPIVGVGVFKTDGACDITGGEMILNDNGTITGPSTDSPTFPSVVAFGGTLGSNVVGAYEYNADSTGTVTLVNASLDGGSATFGVANEIGNTEARGTRVTPGNPLTIVIEKQSAVTAAQFGETALGTNSALLCAGVGEPGNVLGLGGGSAAGTNSSNLDPETVSLPQAGGDLFYNNNNGTITGVGQVIPPGGGAFVCDFNQAYLSTPSLTDGTQNTDAAFLANFSCPLTTAHDETSAVLWGTGNNRAFVIVTGANGAAFQSVSSCTSGSALESIDTITAATIMVTSALNPHPSKTITITNGRGRPLNYTSLTLSSLPQVTITGGTCLTAGGNVPANNALIGGPFPVGTNTCTVILTNSGTSCNTGAGKEVGFLNVNGNDHTIISCAQNSTGCTANVTCE